MNAKLLFPCYCHFLRRCTWTSTGENIEYGLGNESVFNNGCVIRYVHLGHLRVNTLTSFSQEL